MMTRTLVACHNWFRPIAGEVRELGLASFRPARHLYRFTLGPAAASRVIDYEIASYHESDEAALVEFFGDVLGELGFDFDLAVKDRDLSRIPEVYRTNGGTFLLARRAGRIVGTIALRHLGKTSCELKRFYVRDAHRGNGVGTALLSGLLDHARRGAWETIRLDTSSKSPAAIMLFRRHGFIEIPRYNDDPFAEVFMELALR